MRQLKTKNLNDFPGMILVTRKAELDLMESWLPILYFVLQLLVDLDTGSEVPDPMP